VINIDPYNTQAGNVRIPKAEWGIDAAQPIEVLDLIDGARYRWTGEWNYVELNPHVLPGHVLRLQSEEGPAGGRAESTP
jgi:starch synthase (maltosyl-transferring)